MKRSASFVGGIVMLASAWACSAPFGGGDDDDSPSSPNSGTSGKAGSKSTTEGDAGDASSAGGAGSENDSGGSSSTAGTDATAGGTTTTAGTASSAGTASTIGGADDGAAGEGGAGPALPVFTVSQLLDDMEDGNGTLLDTNGDWFVIKDATGGIITPPKDKPFTMTTLTPARGASKKAAVVTVSGFSDWGAAVGFDFSYVAGLRQQTDLKETLAVRFWAKASAATTLRLQLPNIDTDILGGKCSGTGDNACGAHWTRTFKVGTEWQEITVLLSTLKQDLDGRKVPSFDKKHVYSTFFVIGPDQSLTVWLDDIALVH